MNKVAAPESSGTRSSRIREDRFHLRTGTTHISVIYRGPALRDLKPLAFDQPLHLTAAGYLLIMTCFEENIEVIYIIVIADGAAVTIWSIMNRKLHNLTI